MEIKNVKRDGKLDKEFGKDNAEISRELAADRDEYLEMNNLSKHESKTDSKKG